MVTNWLGQRLEVVYRKGLILFIIIIDDIDEEVLWEISKFVDDRKLASRVNTLNDIRSMKMNLGKLVAWANR